MLPLVELEKIRARTSFWGWGAGGSQEFSLGHVNFEMSVHHPRVWNSREGSGLVI